MRVQLTAGIGCTGGGDGAAAAALLYRRLTVAQPYALYPAIKQLANSASERACCWTGNDTTNLLASVRELNEVVTKTPRDELQTLMPTVFSPLSKAINHEEVEVRKVVVLVRHPPFLLSRGTHTGSALTEGCVGLRRGWFRCSLSSGPPWIPS